MLVIENSTNQIGCKASECEAEEVKEEVRSVTHRKRIHIPGAGHWGLELEMKLAFCCTLSVSNLIEFKLFVLFGSAFESYKDFPWKSI